MPEVNGSWHLQELSVINQKTLSVACYHDLAMWAVYWDLNDVIIVSCGEIQGQILSQRGSNLISFLLTLSFQISFISSPKWTWEKWSYCWNKCSIAAKTTSKSKLIRKNECFNPVSIFNFWVWNTLEKSRKLLIDWRSHWCWQR